MLAASPERFIGPVPVASDVEGFPGAGACAIEIFVSPERMLRDWPTNNEAFVPSLCANTKARTAANIAFAQNLRVDASG